MVGPPCPRHVPALLPATPGSRASQPTPAGQHRQTAPRHHHGRLGLTGRWKGPQGARRLAEHCGGHSPQGGCSLGDTPGCAHTGEVQDEAVLHGGVGRAVPQGAVPGGPGSRVAVPGGPASQGLGVPEQWLFLPGSCPSLPGTVSVVGMSGVWGGWPWPGICCPVGTTEPHLSLTRGQCSSGTVSGVRPEMNLL